MTQTPLNPTGLDAYQPSEIARRIEEAGVRKAHLPFVRLMTLAVLAGAFIALGGAFYTVTIAGADPISGPVRLLGGAAFSLGLILVIVGGAELFTGNALIVMAWVDRRVSLQELSRNWVIVYCGNLIGALMLVALMALSGLPQGASAEAARAIAEGKMALDPVSAFFRGVACNLLVCLAVWLSFAARDAAGKILAIVWPITAFVALGFEHSIANMYLIPIGLTAGASGDLMDIIANLLPVTLGNIVGGAGGVALAYRLAYGSQAGGSTS